MITNNLYVIAAVCGNFWQESTVNPGVYEGLDPAGAGYGLGQWTDNAVTHRKTDLFNWLSANGYARNSGEGQLEYLMYENVWLGNGAGHTSAYSSLTEFLQSTSNNLSDLTYEFMTQWEGIDDGTLPRRLNGAQVFHDAFLNDTGTRVPWTAGNFLLSWEQATNNALHILDFFLENDHALTDAEVAAIVQLALKRRRRGGGIIVF